MDPFENLPPGFKKALDKAPPEVKDALKGFEEGTQIEVEGVDLDSVLAGGPVSVDEVLKALPDGIVKGVEGIEVRDIGEFTVGEVEISGGPDHKLEVRFSRDAYGPGDTVQGVIAAREKMKARQVNVELCYVEQSPDYVEQVAYDSAEGLHKGSLEPGAEVPFALTLPKGAPPNWDPAGVAAALAGRPPRALGQRALGLAGYGRLYWAVVVTGTRRGVVPHNVERHPVPLVGDPAVWLGPGQPEGAGEIKASGKGWDVEAEVRPETPRRGEELRVGLTIGEPDAGRDSLEVGLICEIHYDVESRSQDTNGHGTTSRGTRMATAHEEWVRPDPSQPLQELRLLVPEDAPFSHGEARAKSLAGGRFTFSKSKLRHESAFSAVWKLIVREDRKLRRNPSHEIALHVLP